MMPARTERTADPDEPLLEIIRALARQAAREDHDAAVQALRTAPLPPPR